MLLAMAFAIAVGVIKNLTNTLPVSEILILIGILVTLVFAIIAKRRKEALYSKDMLSKIFLLRLFPDILARIFFVPSLALISLSMAASILQSVAILATMGAGLWQGQSVGWRRWSTTCVGFFKVLVIMRPGFDGFEPAAILALMGAICLAVRDLATRALKSYISTFSVSASAFAASMIAASMIAGLLLIPTGGSLVQPDGSQIGLLLLVILLGVLPIAPLF